METWQNIVDMIATIITAIGTVGAVIVALWMSYQNNRVKLRVSATVGLVMPDNDKFVWLSCINYGNRPITCTGFAFAPRKKSHCV